MGMAGYGALQLIELHIECTIENVWHVGDFAPLLLPHTWLYKHYTALCVSV